MNGGKDKNKSCCRILQVKAIKKIAIKFNKADFLLMKYKIPNKIQNLTSTYKDQNDPSIGSNLKKYCNLFMMLGSINSSPGKISMKFI